MNYAPSRIFDLRNNFTDAGNVEITQNEFGPVMADTIDARSMGVISFWRAHLNWAKTNAVSLPIPDAAPEVPCMRF